MWLSNFKILVPNSDFLNSILHLNLELLKYIFGSYIFLHIIYITYQRYGIVRKRLEIYCLLSLRKPTEANMSLEGAMLSIPSEDDMIKNNGNNIHWHIIGGQHTVKSFRKLANWHPQGSREHQDLLEFEVIPMFNKDPHLLTQVSYALNLTLHIN